VEEVPILILVKDADPGGLRAGKFEQVEIVLNLALGYSSGVNETW
jgi:hypothetical protein